MASINRTIIATSLIALFIVPGATAAQEPPELHIKDYKIFVQQLERPVMRKDAKGEKQRYEKVYVVELKGYFGEPRAIPIDIYIGDYRIPEYGGTKDGVYFKIYDSALLERLEGQPFALGIENRKVKILKLKFTPSAQRKWRK